MSSPQQQAKELLDTLATPCDVGRPGEWYGDREPCEESAHYTLQVHDCTGGPVPALWCDTHLTNSVYSWSRFLQRAGRFTCTPCLEEISDIDQILMNITPLN